MKKFVIFFVITLLSFGCASIPPQITEFNAHPNSLEDGGKVNISWNVTEDAKVDITDIGEDLPPKGSREIIVNSSKTLKLFAHNGKVNSSALLNITVTPKKIEQVKPISTPIVEKKNETKSNYLKGRVNIENVKKEDDPKLIINLIDYKEFSNQVRLFCTVKDIYGNHVANLAPPYNNAYLSNWKSVIEKAEGKEKAIKDFKVEEIREDVAPPFSTSFVLDYSGSMNRDYGFVEEALNSAMKYLRPGKDDYEVVQFDHRYGKSIDRNSSAAGLSNLIPFMNMAGYTAFYDASCFAQKNLQTSNKERVSILFTDGGDNASFNQANDLVNESRAIGAKVFIIGFNRPNGGFLTATLSAIAEQTGGKAYFPSSLSEMDDIFAEIYQIMNVYYIVSYKTSKNGADVRNISLKLDLPDLDKTLTADRDLYINPKPINSPRIISVAYFKTGKSEILDEYKKLIDDIAEYLKKEPNKKIDINGHTDSKGNDAKNMILSKRRAEAIANYLISKGVKKNQIVKILGKGESELIYPNEIDEYEIQGNRRVEINFI